MAGFCR